MVEQMLGVALVDAPKLALAGISMMVSAEPDMEVVFESSDVHQALEGIALLRSRKNVVALIGLSLTGDHDSYWLIRSIRDRAPSIPILAASTNSDDMTVSRALFMGADGFVDKDAEPAALLDGLRRTADGQVVLTGVPDTWVGAIADGIEKQQEQATESTLTERELEVLAVATEGLTARQIGQRLGVRERTVTTHLSRIYKKLGAASRVGAIATAAQSGLVRVGQRS
ncbi:MAG TPA: response regulator transcription factor [Actinomycetota bacterium]